MTETAGQLVLYNDGLSHDAVAVGSMYNNTAPKFDYN